MNASKMYSKAVATLKPNKAKMAAIREAHAALVAEAEKEVHAMMMRTKKTGTQLYRECVRSENETELEKTIRVVLLGLARKGL